MYKGILINRQSKYYAGDDFNFTFVVEDENGDLLSSFINWTFRAELYSLANSVPNSQITITTSGNKVYVSIPNSATEDLNDNVKYILILKGTLGGKDYSIGREILWINEEILD